MRYSIISVCTVLFLVGSIDQGLIAQEDKVGIFVASSYTSLKRTESFPFAPLSDNQVQNWEFGLYLPVVANKNYYASAKLSYLNYGFDESFRVNGRDIQTSHSFQGARLSFTPLGIKVPIGETALLFGLGGFATYQFSGEVTESSVDYVYDEDIFEPIHYGGQANFNLRFKNFILGFEMFNSMNNLIKATNLSSTNVRTIEIPDVPSRLRGGSLSLTITLPSKTSSQIIIE